MIVVYTRCSGILLEQKGILVIFAEYIFLLLLLYIFFFRRSININERKKKSKTYVILMYGNMYNISINVGILSNIFIDRPICLHPGTTTKIFKLYLFLSSSSSSQRIVPSIYITLREYSQSNSNCKLKVPLDSNRSISLWLKEQGTQRIRQNGPGKIFAQKQNNTTTSAFHQNGI